MRSLAEAAAEHLLDGGHAHRFVLGLVASLISSLTKAIEGTVLIEDAWNPEFEGAGALVAPYVRLSIALDAP
jgi:hypothetical protein